MFEYFRKSIYAGYLQNRGTVGKEGIPHIKISQTYRIECFYMTLRFRECGV